MLLYILLRMHVCFCCVGFSFSVLSQEIGWEERLQHDLFLCQLGCWTSALSGLMNFHALCCLYCTTCSIQWPMYQLCFIQWSDEDPQCCKHGVLLIQACVERECYPSPLNYYKFPKSCCTWVAFCVHGVERCTCISCGEWRIVLCWVERETLTQSISRQRSSSVETAR